MLRLCRTVFPSAAPFHVPTSNVWGSSSSTSSSTLVIACLFYYRHSSGGAVVFICISLQTNDEHLFVCFLAIHICLWWNVCLILWPIFKLSYLSYYWVIKVFYIFWMQILLPDIRFPGIFSSVNCFHVLSGVFFFFNWKVFNFYGAPFIGFSYITCALVSYLGTRANARSWSFMPCFLLRILLFWLFHLDLWPIVS